MKIGFEILDNVVEQNGGKRIGHLSLQRQVAPDPDLCSSTVSDETRPLPAFGFPRSAGPARKARCWHHAPVLPDGASGFAKSV